MSQTREPVRTPPPANPAGRESASTAEDVAAQRESASTADGLAAQRAALVERERRTAHARTAARRLDRARP